MRFDCFSTWSLLVALSIATIVESSPTFQCEKEGYHADPQDCRVYYRCVDFGNGAPLVKYRFACGPGTVFSKVQGDICTHPWACGRKECGGTVGTDTDNKPGADKNPVVQIEPVTQPSRPPCSHCGSSHVSESTEHPTHLPSSLTEPTVTIASIKPSSAAPTQGPCKVPTDSSPSPQPSSETEPTVTFPTAKPSSAKPSQATTVTPVPKPPTDGPQCTCEGFMADPRDCSKFYRCVSYGTGSYKRHEFTCGNGTMWDPKIESCNHPWAAHRVGCTVPTVSSQSPRPTPVTEPTVTIATATPSSAKSSQATTVTPVPKPSTNGPQCTCEGFMADPKDCSKFYRCVSYGIGSYKRHEFTCGNGTVWDPKIESCNHPWAAQRVGCTVPAVSSPSPRPTPVTEPTVTIATVKPSSAKPSQATTITPVPKPPTNDPQCTCEGFMADPKDCSKYYRCVSYGTGSYKRHEFICGNGTVWDPKIERCNHPWAAHRVRCTVPAVSSPSPRPTPATEPTVTIATMKPSSAKPSQATTVTPVPKPPTNGPQCTCEGFMADPKDCSKYYRCISYGTGSYKRHEFTCGNGNVWDAKIESCNHPWAAHRVGCTGPTISSPSPRPTPVTEPTVTIATATSSSAKPSQATTVTPVPKPPTNGPQCTCEGFMADPKDCSKYYRCVSYGTGSYKRHEFICGNGTVWDPKIESCNHPWAAHRVGCTIPTVSSPSPRPTPVTEPTVTIATVKPSSAKPSQATTVTPVPKPPTNGPQCTCEGFMADPKDCSKYYRCVSYGTGSYKRHEFTCGNGTVWDPKIESCNHPWAAHRVGCTGPTVSSPSPRPTPVTESTVTIATVKPSSAKPSQATTVTPVPKPPTNGPQCTCEGFMADPKDCSKYYRCVSYGTGSYKRHEFTCGNGTVWDPKIESCNHPWAAHRVGCTGPTVSSPSPRPTPVTESTVTIATVKPSSAKPSQATTVTPVPKPPTNGPQCTCEGFMADPKDCSKYYRCVSYGTGPYKRHEFTCGNGTVWDPKIESCNHPWAAHRVGCTIPTVSSSSPRPTPVTEPTVTIATVKPSSAKPSQATTVTPVPKPPTNGPQCTCEGFMANPKDCSKYYRCVSYGTGSYKRHEFICGNGTVWDPKIESCNHPWAAHRVGCTITTVSSPSPRPTPVTEPTVTIATVKPTSAKPSQATTVTPVPKPPTDGPQCTCEGFMADPKDCSKYYRCVSYGTGSYKRHEFICGNGTVWDPKIESCNHPWAAHRVGCTGPTISSPSPRPTPVTEPTVTIATATCSSAKPSQATTVTPVPKPPTNGPQCTCEGFMADPKDCSKYYRCVSYGTGSYKRHEFICGNGTVWDPKIKSCNHPWAAHRVGCTIPTVSSPSPRPTPVTEPTVTIATVKPSSAKPSQATTVTPVPKPPTNGPQCTCEGFMADPKDCSKYYQCVSYGTGSYKRHEFICGNGTVWDPKIESCNHPWAAHRVGCTIPTVSSPSPRPTPVTEPTVTIATVKPSSAKPSQATTVTPVPKPPTNGPQCTCEGFMADPKDCSKYYRCISYETGSYKRHEFTCGNGTMWDPKIESCNHPWAAHRVGCTGPTVSSSSPRPTPVTEPTVIIATVKPSSAKPSQATTVTPVPKPPTNGPQCTCEGFMADPKDCSKYYRCVSYGTGSYKRHEFICGNGTVWDPKIESCNHPWAARRVGCTIPTVSSPSPRPIPVTEPTVTIATVKPSSAKPSQATTVTPVPKPPTNGPQCTCEGFMADPKDCSKYYRCVSYGIGSYKRHEFTCGNGTVWDPKIESCNHPWAAHRVGCTGPTVSSPSPRSTPVTEPTVTIATVKPSSAKPSQATTVTPVPKPPTNGPQCTCEGFMTDPKDCSKYYRCVSYGTGSYKRHEFICGNGTVWDPKIESCNHPWAAHRVGCTGPTVSSSSPRPTPVTEPTVTIATVKPSSAKPSQATTVTPVPKPPTNGPQCTCEGFMADPKDCSKYYRCVSYGTGSYKRHEFICGNGTVWDPKIESCNHPWAAHRVGCTIPTVSSPSPRPIPVTEPTVTIATVKPSSAKPSQATTVTPVPKPPTNGPQCTCEGFMADPKDCSKYYRCVSYGTGSYKRHEFTCGNGTVWDPKIESCNHPWAAHRVGCTGPTVSSPSPRPTPVIEPTVTIATVKPSSAKPSQATTVTPVPKPPTNGPQCTCEGFMADPKDCSKYYRCVSYGTGSYKRHEFTCGNGTVWDTKIESCNHPWAAHRVGCTGPTVSSPSPRPTPVTEPTVTIATVKPSSAKPSQATTVTPVPKPPTNGPQCTCEGFMADPKDCSKYYQCVSYGTGSYKRHEFICGNGTVWDPKIESCNHPWAAHRVGCTIPTVSSPSPRPTPVTEPTVTIATVKPSSAKPSQATTVTPVPKPPTNGPQCTCEGFMADPKDCSKYYRCISYGTGSYKRHEFTCGNGTMWDPKIESCNHPWAAHRVGCTGPTVSSSSPRPTPVTEPTVIIATVKPSSAKPSQATTVTPVPKPPTNGPQCTCEGFMADPKDCSKYYRCVSYGTGSYKRHEFICGNGTVWDPKIESCNHPWAARRVGCTIPTVSSPSPRPIPVTEPTVTIATVKPSSAKPSQATTVTPVPKPTTNGPQCTCEGFMADSKDCSKYYRCVSYGTGSYKRHEFICGNGTVWDPKIESCNHPWAAHRVGCTGPTVSSPSPRPTPVTEPTVTIATVKPSSAKPSQATTVTPVPKPPTNGPQCTCEGFMADPKDCSKYYRCVSYGTGSYKRHEFICGNGTVWDPKIESCNHPWAAHRVGCTGPTVSSPSPRPTPVTEPTVTIATVKPSSAKPSQATTVTPVPKPPTNGPQCTCEGFMADPKDCSKYYRCVSYGTGSYKRHEFICGNETVWDPKIESCNHPWAAHRVGCTGPTVSSSSPRPTPVTEPTVTIATVKPSSAKPNQATTVTPVPKPPTNGPQCTCEGFMADPKDCSKYYRCVSYGTGSYKRHEFICGNGTVWDPKIESCNHPWAAHRVGCTIPTVSSPSPRPIPVTEPTVTIATVKPSSAKPSQATTVTPVPKPPTNGPQCTCEGFMADPQDCSKYYRCVSYGIGSYKRHEFTCGNGTVWDPKIESCNHPWAAHRVGCTGPTVSSPSPRPTPVTEPTVTIATVKPSSAKPSQATTVTPVPKPTTNGPQCTCEGFMADPKDCSKYYRCVSYGTGSYKRHEFICGNGTVWDPKIESCNHPWAAHRVGCTIPTVSSPSPRPTPVTEPTVTIATVKPSSAKPSQATTVTPVPKPPTNGPLCTCEGFMADPKDCSKYYRCVSYGTGSYKRHEFTCGNGTVWDPKIESCNHPWATHRVGCTGPTVSSPSPRPTPVTEPTVTIATVNPSSAKPSQATTVTPVPKPPTNGPQCTCEGFMADPKDCSKYYRCVSYGTGSYKRHELICGNGTVWDPKIESCNHPWAAHRVGCKVPTVSSPPPRPTPVTEPTVTIPIVKPSSAKPSQATTVSPVSKPPTDGPQCTCEGFMADPKDCSKFYRCVSYGTGSYKRHEFTCGNGTVWDPKIESCNHPWATHRVGCTGPTVSSPSPRPTPVTEPTVTIATVNPSSAKPSQATTVTPVPKPPTNGPQCTCEGFMADPKDCSKYYRCVSYGTGSYKRHELICGNGTVWDPKIESCNHPWAAHRVGCKVPTVSSPPPRPTPVTEPTVTIPIVKPSSAKPSQATTVSPVSKPPTDGPQCTCEGFMADPKDCSKFYRCVSYAAGSYKRFEFTCGSGTVWDPNIESCNHAWVAERVGCKVPTVSSPSPRPSPVTEPTVTIPTVKPSSAKLSQANTVTPVPEPPCEGPQCTCEGFMADPLDCSKFYRCVSYGIGSYKRHEFTCGSGTVWDPNIESCNHAWAAERVGCKVGGPH